MLGPPYQALVDPTTGIPRMNFNGHPLSDLHSIIIKAQLVSKPKIIDRQAKQNRCRMRLISSFPFLINFLHFRFSLLISSFLLLVVPFIITPARMGSRLCSCCLPEAGDKMINCSKCKEWFHYTWVDLDPDTKIRGSWLYITPLSQVEKFKYILCANNHCGIINRHLYNMYISRCSFLNL